ncbi:4418_t:CDS:1 [Scutellospora calospora]|uniref:4418_t:CDS:1 n=1 Tax=Scutellospora calospora TaxID=85575 RepID=A0ACA9LJR2_9GLOM|nr:4418_t:CDS:1 [Scutellospora calospora]
MGIYTLLTDWIRIITKSPVLENLSKHRKTRLFLELLLVNVTKIVLPVCGVFGAVQIIQEYNNDNNSVGDESGQVLRTISNLGFLICLLLYMVYVTYFSLVYVGRPISQQLQVLLLYTSGALLLIELVYRTFITFAQATDSMNRYEWMIYVFEAIPELVLLVVLGGFILGDWFFKEEASEMIDGSKADVPETIGEIIKMAQGTRKKTAV